MLNFSRRSLLQLAGRSLTSEKLSRTDGASTHPEKFRKATVGAVASSLSFSQQPSC